MADLTDKQKTGIVSGIVALAVLGGIYYFSDVSELDKAWYCELADMVALNVDHVSGGQHTVAYWLDDNGVMQKTQCRVGNLYGSWIKVKDSELLSKPIAAPDELEPIPAGNSAAPVQCCHSNPKVCTPGPCPE